MKEKKAEVTEKLVISHDSVIKMARGVSTYEAGCTLGKFQGTYNISSVEDALAIRLAHRQPYGSEYPTYVFLNLAHPTIDTTKKSIQRGGNGPKIYSFLIQAGWKLIARMPGAHSSEVEGKDYTSFLMGARTAGDAKELEGMLAEDLALEDEAICAERKVKVKSEGSKTKSRRN